MNDNLFEAQYDLTKKSKLKIFYNKFKFVIFLLIATTAASLISYSLYVEYKENKRISLAEHYLQAKVYLQDGKKNEATNLLKKIVYENDSTYSTLAFFLIHNQNLIVDKKEILILFNNIIDKNKFSKEDKNLLIYKKALFISNFANETELLSDIKPLLNSDTFWKAHGLLLIGDYFVSRNESLKAIDFYQQVFNIKNLNQDLYNHARFQLSLISDE